MHHSNFSTPANGMALFRREAP